VGSSVIIREGGEEKGKFWQVGGIKLSKEMLLEPEYDTVNLLQAVARLHQKSKERVVARGWSQGVGKQKTKNKTEKPTGPNKIPTKKSCLHIINCFEAEDQSRMALIGMPSPLQKFKKKKISEEDRN